MSNGDLHVPVAKIVEQIVMDVLEIESEGQIADIVVRGKDCSGGQQLYLYYDIPHADGTFRNYHYSFPDLLVIPRETVRGIIEVENQMIRPREIFGKFCTANFARYYIPSGINKLRDVPSNKKDLDSIVFVHIIRSERDHYRLMKIKSDIRDHIMAHSGGIVERYELLGGEESDFEEGGRWRRELYDAVKSMFE